MALNDLNKPEIDQFLRRPLFASFATVGRSGAPHLTYMWYTWDGHEFLISTTTDRVKYKNVQRDPHVGLAIADPDNPYRYVSVSGVAEISQERAQELIVEEAVRYMGEEKGRPFATQMSTPNRIVMRVRPEKAIVWGF